VEVSSSPVLGSPLVLDHPLGGSDSSYYAPPVASAEVLSSSSGSNKENVAIDSQLVEIKDEVMEDLLLVPAPQLDFQGIACLMAVHGQRAVRSKGPPKSAYHPYVHRCAIGDQDLTHQPSSLCLPPLLARRSPSSSCQVGDEGYDSPSKSPLRVGSDGGWAQQF